jgi:hypothetical protein
MSTDDNQLQPFPHSESLDALLALMKVRDGVEVVEEPEAGE